MERDMASQSGTAKVVRLFQGREGDATQDPAPEGVVVAQAANEPPLRERRAQRSENLQLLSYLDLARPVAVASVLTIAALLVLLLQVQLIGYMPQSYQGRLLALAGVLSFATLVMLLWRVRTSELLRRSRDLQAEVEARTRELSARTEELLVAVRSKAQLITELRMASDAFERQAREDSLTGLANRRHFDAMAADWFATCRRNRRPISAALLDIDHFKDVNDGYSHAAGDAVLRRMGELIAAECGDTALAARYGGEEFALLFPNCDAQLALEACDRLRAACAASEFEHGDWRFRVTLSGGVADDPAAESHERLLAAADARMYEAKRAGRNRVAS